MSEPTAEDATRRTRLANERTALAWWRTGLTAMAAAVGAGKLVPALSDGASAGYTALGVAFALLGIACCAYATLRHRTVEEVLDRGAFAPPHRGAMTVLGAAGGLIGLALVALLLFA